MGEKTINFRVFKVKFAQVDNIEFGYKNQDSQGIAVHRSIKILAKDVKTEKEAFFNCYGDGSFVTVDFFPYHEIEEDGLSPMRCFPLTTKEADEFWEHFSA